MCLSQHSRVSSVRADSAALITNPESIIVTSNAIYLFLKVLRAPNNSLTTRDTSMAQGSLADEGMQIPAQYILFSTSSL